MTSGDAYLKFKQKVNKNSTNDNINVDKARFVLLFNEEQNKFVEWVLEKRNEDDIRDIQKLLVSDLRLDKNGIVLNHHDFKLPSDYFSFSNIQVFASKDNCAHKKITVWEVKSENLEELFEDVDNNPSFEYRETFYKIGSDLVNVYVDDFDVTKVFLTYYRYPKQIDIEGYIKSDNVASTNIDPEFEDRIVDRILSAAAKSFNINNENPQKAQFDRDRVYSKI